MQPEVKKLLWDVREAATSILSFSRGCHERELLTDEVYRSAVYFKFMIIGEPIAQMKRFDSKIAESIRDHWKITGFRNRIVHHYGGLDDDLTRQTIQEDLPPLIEQVEHLLSS